MVKITNPLGDVKIGKQGEVVYQRHYGEQTRRMLSPKRAIASEAQVAHRQLYRAALDWRKLLSRPNRRYLEGYCIANGVVDGYHIPLPWHRFALKLYLEHVHFVVIDKPTLSYEKTEGMFEHYDDEEQLDAAWSIYGNTWRGQTFTPLVTHDLIKIELWITRYDTIGTVTISIRATDAEGRPTGEDLVSKSFPGSEIPTAYVWKEILLPYHELILETQYAIIARLAGGSSSNFLVWRVDKTDPSYTRGVKLRSDNAGVSWTLIPSEDFGFREYGESATEIKVAGLIHVRHPALMSVVHKRGEVTINQYENLSSLDEEYLTKQVGIDVEGGDTIKATTIAGIESSYTIH